MGLTKELLKNLSPELVLWNFAGRPKLIKHGWPIRLLRWLLRKGPDYKYNMLQLPKNKERIKFKRYGK